MDPIDTLFDYRGLGGCTSRCRVRIFPIPHPGPACPDPGDLAPTEATGPIIILTELPDNPGTSITNAAEGLATQVVAALNLDLQTCHPRWVEQYPSSHATPETLAWIQLEWQGRIDPVTNQLVFTATHATWTPLTRDTLERCYLFAPLL